MKTLNIEALTKADRTISLFGKTHDVVEMTVENFIATTEAAEKLGANPSMKEQIAETIEMIARSVPTVDRADLKKLTLEQLSTVIRFIRGDLDEPAKEAGEAPQEGVEGK